MGYALSAKGGRVDSLKGAGTSTGYLDVSTTGTNVKGAWQELTASSGLPVTVDVLTICFGGASTSGTFLVDIGITPVGGGTPTVIIANLLFKTSNDFAANGRELSFRYRLPTGTRVWVRQANDVGAARGVRVALLTRAGHGPGRAAALNRITTYGAVTASSRGTNVDPGAVAGAKGGWVELAASLTYPVKAIALSIVQAAGVVFSTYRYDLGTGAAGSERVIVPDFPQHAADLGQGLPPGAPWFDVTLPAGARLLIRSACDSTAANRVACVTAHCQG